MQEQLSALGLSTDGKREELASRLDSHLSNLESLSVKPQSLVKEISLALVERSSVESAKPRATRCMQEEDQSDIPDNLEEVTNENLEDSTFTLESLLSQTKVATNPPSAVWLALSQHDMQAISGAHHDQTHRLQAQLSAELALRGLPKSGLKADLAQRLFEAIQTDGGRNDVTDLPVEADATASP